MACAAALGSRLPADDPIGKLETRVPCRAITGGPLHHWFGYYDKREFDSANQKVLTNQVEFEGRSPRSEDEIKVGFIDTADQDRWHEIGSSHAWGWQQGCMLQWIGEGKEVLWNDRDGDAFVCRIHSIESGRTRTLPMPIYTISPDGSFGLTADFRRINNLRPGYGYSGLPDPFVDQRAPQDSGVWRVELATGRAELIFSLRDAAAIPWETRRGKSDPKVAWHYFNHLLISPDSSRFIVLQRYRPSFDPETRQFQGGFVTRMVTADVDGTRRYVLDPSGYTSHFIWKNPEVVTMWTRPSGQADGFYEFVDQQRRIRPVGAESMKRNGHNTYLPDPYADWILNDTYPDSKTRRQVVYLYHVPTQRRFDLGFFPSPQTYRGEWRCDTHPRASNDGRLVAIDSPHEGGRQVYLLEIGELLDRES
ncbi:MAG: hypothetical protein AAGJ83_06385 [Planctomycetota bacterium]